MKKVKILALIAAVATCLLLYIYLNSLNQQNEIPKTKVVTAVTDIPAETAITAEMIKVSDLPSEAVIAGAISDTSAVIGKISDADIFAGEQMLGSKLNSAGDSESETLAYAIEPGMRAITIPVDETSGIAFMVTPGDHVDILGYFLTEKNAEEGGTEKISYTTMLLENITVLAVDNVYSDAGKTNSETPAYTTMTLQVTPQQAMKLSMAQSEGVIRTVLRSPLDEDEAGLPKIKLDDILGK